MSGRADYTTNTILVQEEVTNNIGAVSLLGSTVREKQLTLANAIAITDTGVHSYDLITHGLLAEDEIRRYRRFKIHVISSHDQAATVSLNYGIKSFGLTTLVGATLMYFEASNLIATSGRVLMHSKAGGVGGTANIKSIPTLEGIFSNLIINVAFVVAPASGSLTIGVEMGE